MEHINNIENTKNKYDWPTIKQLADILIKKDQCDDDYNNMCRQMYGLLFRHQESLMQLVELGPIWDGDVISKSYRDDLIFLGFATRVCVKGKQGYTAATYSGWDVYKAGINEGRFKQE